MRYKYRSSFKKALSVLMLGSLSFAIAGCVGSRPVQTPIHDGVLGTVFLENGLDNSFQAAHPIKLAETTVADILRGVHTKEKAGLLLLFGKAARSTNLNDIRTFSESDIAFLAPHIAAALAQATPNQRVGFRIYSAPELSQASKVSQNRETTSGYLFADGLSLHFTLTQYRYNPGKKAKVPEKDPRPLPDSDGLRDRAVTFLPEEAVRQDVYDRSSWFRKSEDRSVAIDYQLLASILSGPPAPAPTAQPSPSGMAPVVQPPQSIPVQTLSPSKNDAELQTFKEELKALQQKVDEQNAELQRLKEAPPKKK